MLPKYKLVRLTASTAVTAIPGNVMGILLASGTASMTVSLTDDANGAGTKVIELSAVANSFAFVDFTPFGGVFFPTKIYGTLGGTGAIAYVWVD